MKIRRKIIDSLPWEVEGLHASLGAFVFARAAQETLRATLLTLTFSFGAGDETGVGAPAKRQYASDMVFQEQKHETPSSAMEFS